MIIQSEMFDKVIDPKDVVYTNRIIAKDIINRLQINGLCLDPCKGDGSFYDQIESPFKEYCELNEKKDFFNWTNKVDWIIGNPPYSIFDKFLEKSFELADNVSFLVPTNKIFQRQIIMEMINNYGGIRSIIIYGSGQLIGFPFGFSVGNFHFEKYYKGPCNLIMGLKALNF